MSVKLTHPNGGKITASEDHADMYVAAGWQRVTATAEPKPKRAYTRKTTAAKVADTTTKKK